MARLACAWLGKEVRFGSGSHNGGSHQCVDAFSHEDQTQSQPLGGPASKVNKTALYQTLQRKDMW